MNDNDSSKPTPIVSSSQPQDDKGATSLGKSKRKAIKSRSDIWDHFTKFANDEGQIKEKCNYFSREFNCDPKKEYGTTALRNHMRTCKKHPYTIESHQMELYLQSTKIEGEREW